jgi:hypothetical protein
MKSMLKLFTAILVCGLFLVGCGSGGGDGTQETLPDTFAEMESAFPAFQAGTANINATEKGKIYNISQTAFDEFKTSVLDAPPAYNNPYGDVYIRIDGGIMYYANYNATTNTLFVSIAGVNLPDFSVLNDIAFDDEFSTINGKLTEAVVYFYYDDNIKSKYYDYTMILKSDPDFRCDIGFSTGNKYICNKDSNSKTFTYIWQEIANNGYLYSVKIK